MSAHYHDLLNELNKLNKARLGSFGELIFESTALELNRKIESQRNQCTDFRMDGQPIDVKTTLRNMGKRHEDVKIRTYKGRRVEGIKYALVEFCSDTVQLSIEGELFSFKSWSDIYELWLQWNVKRKISQTSEMRNKHKEIISEIQAEL